MFKVPGVVECHSLVCRDDAGVTTAVIVPAWGANVVALSYQEHDWAWPIPVLESVDIATIAAKPSSYGVPILAPTPGRVGRNQNGRFQYQGKDYCVAPKRHGFLRNLPWTVTSRSTTSLTCVVDVFPSHNAAASDSFPFQFRAVYEVEITSGRLRCRIRINNTSNRVQPIDVGWHPYLHRSGACKVCLPAGSRWELDKEPEPTPTGRVLEVSDRDDFRAGRFVDTNEHWDDVFTDLKYERGEALCWVEETMQVLEKNGTYTPARIRRTLGMRAAPGLSGTRRIQSVQLYTPPGRKAISIEPLSAPPNAINLLHQGCKRANVCNLQPNEEVVHEIVIGVEAASV